MMNFASLRPRPDQERRQGQAKPLPAWIEFISPSHAWIEFISPSSGREGRKPGELDRYSSITLHYGEVHSRHDRSTSYRSARRTLAYKASLLRRRNSSLIARASQQASKPLLTQLLIYKKKKALPPFLNNKVSFQAPLLEILLVKRWSALCILYKGKALIFPILLIGGCGAFCFLFVRAVRRCLG